MHKYLLGLIAALPLIGHAGTMYYCRDIDGEFWGEAPCNTYDAMLIRSVHNVPDFDDFDIKVAWARGQLYNNTHNYESHTYITPANPSTTHRFTQTIRSGRR